MLSRLVSAALLLAAGVVLPAFAEAKPYLEAVSKDELRIISDLTNGRIVEATPFSANGNLGSLFKVTVEHEGRRHTALFKPRQLGDRDGWARETMEPAVYKLDRILGLDLVPPAVYRHNIDVNWQNYSEGALVLFTDGAHKIDGVPEQEWSPRREVFSSDLRILQAISRDADNQNGNNIIRARHWLDGKWRVMKIDSDASMRNGAYVNLDHQHPTWGPVTRFKRETYQRLKELNFNDLKGDVGMYLSDGEINDWLNTAKGLVSHIDREAGKRKDVFFSSSETAFEARARLGEPASKAFQAKFKGLLAKKGVKLEILDASDPRLDGAQAKTVLQPGGIVVLATADPTRATLTEELVHVNQLRIMARRAGGFAALHTRFSAEKQWASSMTGSMEAYAKGKVAMTLQGKDRAAAQASRASFSRQATAGARASTSPAPKSSTPKRDPRTMWRTGAGKPPRR